MMEFQSSLISWYLANKRDLPWRQTQDPFLIWMSEIILQQTRVAQGLPYYLKFVEAFPTVESLAQADEQEVLNLWQGLGYYSRARNMLTTAKRVVHEYHGIFPIQFEELKKLKGVGEYTAAAIASFAANEAVAVLDGNVYRVLARLFGIYEPVDEHGGKKIFRELADACLPQGNESTYNQAMMELGALICLPKAPKCMICPIAANCEAVKSKSQLELPVKSKSVKIRTRYFNFIVSETSSGYALLRREGNDVWKHLFQFPLIETSECSDFVDLIPVLGTKTKLLKVSDEIKHKLTHQTLFCKFWQVADVDSEFFNNVRRYDISRFSELPFPKVVENYVAHELVLSR